jgi:hypothetical protein
MTRFTKSANGKYMVSGHSFDMLIGSRAQVWHGTAYKTTGGLTKSNIMKNKTGSIVSKSKHASAKRENRLVKAGYVTHKGKFGSHKVGSKSSKKSRKRRGGAAAAPSTINTANIKAGAGTGSNITAAKAAIAAAK